MDCTRQHFEDTIAASFPNAIFHSEFTSHNDFIIYAFNYSVDQSQFQALSSVYNKFVAACYVWEFVTTRGLVGMVFSQSMGSITKDRTALFQGPQSLSSPANVPSSQSGHVLISNGTTWQSFQPPPKAVPAGFFDDPNWQSLQGINDMPSTQGCQHQWKLYEGFTQVYNYCTKCDVKQ